MKISVAQGYNEPGISLPFSCDMQRFLRTELSSIVEASTSFAKKYDSDYMIYVSMDAKTGGDDVIVIGPLIYRQTREVQFTVVLPFDVIVRSADGPRCALRLLLEGIRIVLGRYQIDTTKLVAHEERIIEAICSEPKMFETDPWPTLSLMARVESTATGVFFQRLYNSVAGAIQRVAVRTAVDEGPVARKLYKLIDGVLHYEEAWEYQGRVYHHCGKVGQRGRSTEFPFLNRTPRQAVNEALAPAVAKGFTEMSEDHQIEIQYAIDGFGSEEDLEKLHALEERLHDLLGLLGLGVCTDNSIGSDTMEVCCFVVDADIAMKCIKKSLKGTRFSDYVTMQVVERDEEGDEE